MPKGRGFTARLIKKIEVPNGSSPRLWGTLLVKTIDFTKKNYCIETYQKIEEKSKQLTSSKVFRLEGLVFYNLKSVIMRQS